jgi:hypothetical protein
MGTSKAEAACPAREEKSRNICSFNRVWKIWMATFISGYVIIYMEQNFIHSFIEIKGGKHKWIFYFHLDWRFHLVQSLHY